MTEQKKGLSPLAWIAIGVVSVLVLGMLAVGALTWFAFSKAKEFVDNPAKVIELVVSANPDLELVSTDDNAGTFTIRNIETGEVVTFDYSDITDGNFSISTEDGQIVINASGEDGGTVQITGKEGETLVDISGTEDGGTVTISDGEGNMALVAKGNDKGGTWTAKGKDGTVKVATGDKAEPIADWVPPYPNAGDPISQFSSSGDQGQSGTATYETTDPVGEVLDYFEGKLEDEGYQVQKTTYSGDQGNSGAVVASRNDGIRSVNVMVSEKDGRTQFVLNYNERKPD